LTGKFAALDIVRARAASAPEKIFENPAGTVSDSRGILMTDRKCDYCHHVNPAAAEVCEACDYPLGDADAEGAGETFDPSTGGFNAYGGATSGGAPPPDVSSPRFKDAGDVMSPTLEVYRKNFLPIGILVAVTSLPVALLQYAIILVATERSSGPLPMGEGAAITFVLTTGLAAGLLSILGTSVLSGSLVHAVIEIKRTGTAAAGESLRSGLRLLPKVFVVTLLYTVITLVGYVLLIVPGIIFSLMYAVAVPVAVLEKRGPFESLKRSAVLTEGYRGLIFLTYFLWGLLIMVLTFVVSGSFTAAGAQGSLGAVLAESLVGGMLNSSATVLTVYIFLGLLNEREGGFETRAFTHGPETAAR
jgi:hypothetical protein